MAILSDDEKLEKHKKNPVVKPETIAYDRVFENSIRPKSFESYIGQTALKETLKISIEAAKKRNTTLDHVLFYGPPGLGKTTLAGIIAEELNTSVKITSAPSFERPRDIIGVLMSLKEGEVLFIDEIHRLNTVTEEILYPAMEDFYLDMMTGKTQTVKTMRIQLPKFTLVGATTKAGGISSPLRDRFGFVHRLQFYTTEELSQVILRTAKILNIEVSSDSAEEIAKRSRGTPRIANRLLKRVGDFAIVKNNGKVDLKIAKDSLNTLKIDEYGLDETDREMLKLIINKYNGGPVGLDTIAAALGEDVRTIEDVCEPYLLQAGLLMRTPRGRKVSPEAYVHLGLGIFNEQ
ncbi:Holliday junction branch migration DNA helicase RuvB [bacterium]|nr:Holliday junction branch migration DNA helicase RuvB [bacterium]